MEKPLEKRTGELGQHKAAHLLRRTTWVVRPERIHQFAKMTAEEACSELFRDNPSVVKEPIDPVTKEPWIDTGILREATVDEEIEMGASIVGWWINEARLDLGISHKMAFFLHTVFTANVKENEGALAIIFDHLRLLDFYALGNIKDLAKKITLDNLMLDFLDNRYNDKDNPNENYAREFLELFTIGKGPQIGPGNYTHFTEQDVVTAARLFSGFRQDKSRVAFDPDTKIPCGITDFQAHDTEEKNFSSSFGNRTIQGAVNESEMERELSDFVEMVFEQVATARNICRRLYRFFVVSQITPEIEDSVIGPLSETLRENDYELKPVITQLLCSKHFYGEDINDDAITPIGALVKSPIDLGLQLFNFFGFYGTFPSPYQEPSDHYINFYVRWFYFQFLTAAGLPLFTPEVVAGYPGYYQEPAYDDNWFTSSSLTTRYRLIEPFLAPLNLSYDPVVGVRFDLVRFVADVISEPEDAEVLVGELLEYMFCLPPTPERKGYYLNDIFLNGLSVATWRSEWNQFKNSNDPEGVRIPLENLVRKISSSQEYQLM